ncbi:MAG: hypothetical protein AB2693_11475, partial [Candidatus Thiodiazotropha sp.]
CYMHNSTIVRHSTTKAIRDLQCGLNYSMWTLLSESYHNTTQMNRGFAEKHSKNRDTYNNNHYCPESNWPALSYNNVSKR